MVGRDFFFLVGQVSFCLSKRSHCSKSIFSYTIRGFDPIPRVRARPKCQFQNSTEILCYFLCYFLKTPEFGRSPEFREPATPLVPNMTVFVPNATVFVPNMTVLVPNTTVFVPNTTVLSQTQLYLSQLRLYFSKI